MIPIESPFFQVNLIFPTIYIICSILVTLVPMIASPKETGERVVNTRYNDVTSTTLHSTGIGCAIIASGIPVYFILVSEYPFQKPGSIRRFLGQNLHYWQKPSVFPPANTTIGLQKLFVVVTPVKKLD